jgi:hypothetical protein
MIFPKQVQRASVASRWMVICAIASSSFWALPSAGAPKTDTLIFINGDSLTGEIKSLKRGVLSFDIEAAGVINIEWNKVASIVSSQHVQVETASGIRYFGNLTYSESGPGLVVVAANGPQELTWERIIAMTPIEGSGREALDIDVTVGYNFAKAGGVETGNFGLNMAYRSLLRIESMSLSTTLTNSSTLDASRRSNLGLQHTRLFKNRWFGTGNLTLDQNDELGLELRTSIGAGGGRYFVQSTAMLLALEAGLQVSRENQTAVEEDIDSLEAIFTFNWDWFLFDDPELDWSTTIQIIPSLTESGRVRSELNTNLQWELIGDLKWGLSFYGSLDNQANDEDGETSDYGVNTSLIYEF